MNQLITTTWLTGTLPITGDVAEAYGDIYEITDMFTGQFFRLDDGGSKSVPLYTADKMADDMLSRGNNYCCYI